MQTVGTLLRERRLEKGISIQRIAQETRVTQKYLYALENSQHDVFPADSYLIGYLRAYAEYLGFNGNEIITRFRNEVIQEQPAPIEELLGATKKPWARWVLFIVLGVFVLGGVGYLLYANYESLVAFFDRPDKVAIPPSYIDILHGERIVEQSFVNATLLQVEVEDQLFRFGVAIQDAAVFLAYEGNEIPLSQETVRLIDFNEDGDYELSAFVRGINEAEDTVIIRFSRNVAPDALDTPQSSSITLDDLTLENELQEEILDRSEIASFDQRVTPTELLFRMQAPSYIRFRSEDTVQEQLFETGEEVSFTFQESAYISLTNGAAVGLILNDQRYLLQDGSNSFVLHWIFNGTTLKHTLVLSHIR